MAKRITHEVWKLTRGNLDYVCHEGSYQSCLDYVRNANSQFSCGPFQIVAR